MGKRAINKFTDIHGQNIALINAWDLAAIFYKLDLGIKVQMQLIDCLCRVREDLLIACYRENRKRLVYDIAYCNQYLENKRAIEDEITLLEHDLGKSLNFPEDFLSDRFLALYFFFKLNYVKLLSKKLAGKVEPCYIRVRYAKILSLCNVKKRMTNVVKQIELARDAYALRFIAQRKEISDLSAFPVDKYITLALRDSDLDVYDQY